MTRTRAGRTLIVALALLLTPWGASAQTGSPQGKIAFVEDGDIWAWTPNGTGKVLEDGHAQDPTWGPDGTQLLYARNGGSYTNLMLAQVSSGRITRLTDNESDYEVGSPDYVATSMWAIDPYWSRAGIVCYISDAATNGSVMQLWILDPSNGQAYVAADDGGDQGPIEHPSVDAHAAYAVYTVYVSGGLDGGTTYVAMRDINVGTTYPIIEGPQGAFDPAISPDGNSVVATIRDEHGVSDLWFFNRQSDSLTRLTTDEGATNAVWSPDGNWVAYMKLNGSKFEIWALPIDVARGLPVGDAHKLVDARAIDAASGLSWGEDRR